MCPALHECERMPRAQPPPATRWRNTPSYLPTPCAHVAVGIGLCVLPAIYLYGHRDNDTDRKLTSTPHRRQRAERAASAIAQAVTRCGVVVGVHSDPAHPAVKRSSPASVSAS